MARLGFKAYAGAGATDPRLGQRTAAPSNYNLGSAGPQAAPGAWPGTALLGGAGTTAEVTSLLVVTCAELAAFGLLRRVFRRYHGG